MYSKSNNNILSNTIIMPSLCLHEHANFGEKVVKFYTVV